MSKYGPEKTPYLDTFHAVVVERSVASRFSYSVDTQPNITLFKVNNGNIETMLKSVQSHWCHFGAFVVNFKQISSIVLVFPFFWCFWCLVSIYCVLAKWGLRLWYGFMYSWVYYYVLNRACNILLGTIPSREILELFPNFKRL